MGDEDEDPDEVISEPRDVEGDFMARCSSGLTKKGEFNKLVLILLCRNIILKIDKRVFLCNCLKLFRRLELQRSACVEVASVIKKNKIKK